ncbi:hypothetical protein Pmani_031934 [Petrolisthes manimaculis]|uniref:Protein tipE n=1 Tax=Petrolisthes manimaculis TaxID=1843537 RepID=A0AAE1NSR1_9EUCA|nr:hypothetical protein Pmani_031934 [Petrolisthes manimaculis]
MVDNSSSQSGVLLLPTLPNLPSTSSSHEDLEYPLQPRSSPVQQFVPPSLTTKLSEERMEQPSKTEQDIPTIDNLESLVDQAQLDAGKKALRLLLKERKSKKNKKASCASLMKVNITVLAGLMIVLGLFTLLFLVPMTIDPALATLTYNFHSAPVLCMTTFAERVIGLTNISWCSCTEGCTSDVYNCTQITVVYRNCSLRNDTTMENDECDVNANSSFPNNNDNTNTNTEDEEKVITSYIDTDYWDVLNASLFINVKGCGYPPYVDCDTFFDDYGKPGRRFWCYYSEVNKSIVMPKYDPQAAQLDLVNSLGWTVGVQLLGVFIIIVLHCPFKFWIQKCIAFTKK